MVAPNAVCDIVAIGDAVCAPSERACCGVAACDAGCDSPVQVPHQPAGEIFTMDRDEFNEDVSFYNVHQNPVLECDFDRGVHVLYDALQKRDWTAVERIFRESKKESRSRNKEPGMRSRAEILAMTWVYRTDRGDGDDDGGEEEEQQAGGKLKWRILPLHAAVIFDAPISILDQLLRANLSAAKLRDDQGNLPLHLAYKNGLDEDRMKLLQGAYREGTTMKNFRGLTPQDCAAFCSRKKDKAYYDEREPGSEIEDMYDGNGILSMAVLQAEQKRSRGLCAPLGACAPFAPMNDMRDEEELDEEDDILLRPVATAAEIRDEQNSKVQKLTPIEEEGKPPYGEGGDDNESVDLNEYPLINTVISTEKRVRGDDESDGCTIFSAISSDSERMRKYYQPPPRSACGKQVVLWFCG